MILPVVARHGDDLTAFLAIMERGSQTAAARHLRRSLQSINRSLTALERSVGVELINRTTRQMAVPRQWRRKSVRVRGRIRTDGAAAAHATVAGGLGIGLAPLWQIRSLVDAGVVEVILEDFETARIPVQVVSPPTKIPLARAKLFTEFLTARLKSARF